MPRRIVPWRGTSELENMKEKMEKLFEESIGNKWNKWCQALNLDLNNPDIFQNIS